LIVICGVCIRYRYYKNNVINQRRNLTTGNPRIYIPTYLFMNSTATNANPYEQVYTVPTHPEVVLNTEEPPPNYDIAVSSSTAQNKDGI
jgi:hypothetical protein